MEGRRHWSGEHSLRRYFEVAVGIRTLLGYLIVVLFLAADLVMKIGHGYGRKAWCYVSLPASLVVPEDSNFLWCFFAGLAQYLIIGYAVDKIVVPAIERIKR